MLVAHTTCKWSSASMFPCLVPCLWPGTTQKYYFLLQRMQRSFSTYLAGSAHTACTPKELGVLDHLEPKCGSVSDVEPCNKSKHSPVWLAPTSQPRKCSSSSLETALTAILPVSIQFVGSRSCSSCCSSSRICVKIAGRPQKRSRDEA